MAGFVTLVVKRAPQRHPRQCRAACEAALFFWSVAIILFHNEMIMPSLYLARTTLPLQRPLQTLHAMVCGVHVPPLASSSWVPLLDLLNGDNLISPHDGGKAVRDEALCGFASSERDS